MTATSIRFSASARRALLAASLLLAPSPVRAAPRDEVKAGVARCDGISDDRQWLDCFYGAAQPMRARLGLAPAPDFQRKLVPEAAPSMAQPAAAPRTAEKSNGLMSSLLGDDIESRQPMTAYSFDKEGLFTVTLADGTVWRQLSSDGIRAGWRGPAGGYQVTVSKGALGSTNLTLRGSATHYRVKQVK